LPWLRQASTDLKTIVTEVGKGYDSEGTSSSYKVQKLRFAKEAWISLEISD